MGIVILFWCLAAAVTAVPVVPGASQIDLGVWKSVEATTKVADRRPYDPYTQNVYHLFTRLNPTVSQPLVQQIPDTLRTSNYDGRKRTVICVHGYFGKPDDYFNSAMVPAILAGDDVNVIVLDWSVGASESNYEIAMDNTVASGVAVARFINWLSQFTGTNPSMFHLIGYSLGGQQVGVTGRTLNGAVSYITALDPAFLTWEFFNKEHAFRKTDAVYTEVIHTGLGPLRPPIGHVDFYPNGGGGMPGCSDPSCDHRRAVFYMAESVRSGGFTGTRCENFFAALRGDCTSEETLQMGGLRPKTGRTGIYSLETNASSPFSRG